MTGLAPPGRSDLEPGEPIDLLIVGAGPAGLHAAATAQDLGLTHRIIDRRGLAHSFVEYPQSLRFFSPPDEMAIAGVPFPTRGGEKPAREDILPYFRAAAAFRKLNLTLWESIVSVRRDSGLFRVETRQTLDDAAGHTFLTRQILLASGVWDVPVRLRCPGAEMPHVQYRFHEPTEYFDQDVLVIGGGNSAVNAALMLAEAHARVLFVMRRPPVAYQSHLRPFVVRDLELAVQDHRLTLVTEAIVTRIERDTAWITPARYDPAHPAGGQLCGDPYEAPARFVFALLGQRPDTPWLEGLGLALDVDGRPITDGVTYETNQPGIFVAGSLAGQKIDIIITARVQTEAVVRLIAERLEKRSKDDSTA